MTRFDHDPLRANVASAEDEVRRADAEARRRAHEAELAKADAEHARRSGWVSGLMRRLRRVIGG